jgi:hypothetical protein
MERNVTTNLRPAEITHQIYADRDRNPLYVQYHHAVRILTGRSATRSSVMNHSGGWMGGGMWIWTLIGVLVVVLLVVVINKQSRK